MISRHVRNRHSRAVGSVDEPHVLVNGEPLLALYARDEFDSFLRHSHVYRRTLLASGLSCLLGPNGAASRRKIESFGVL